MHHRRKRTTRREVKRMDDKSYRAAESRALDNIEAGPPENPRIESWSYRPEPLPLGDLPCNGKSHSKRKTPKKERCPVNGTHEWYKEWIETEDYYVPYTKCDVCEKRDFSYNWGCKMHGKRTYYKITEHRATCIHCWKEKSLKVHGRSNWWISYRKRKRIIPKRTVKF